MKIYATTLFRPTNNKSSNQINKVTQSINAGRARRALQLFGNPAELVIRAGCADDIPHFKLHLRHGQSIHAPRDIRAQIQKQRFRIGNPRGNSLRKIFRAVCGRIAPKIQKNLPDSLHHLTPFQCRYDHHTPRGGRPALRAPPPARALSKPRRLSQPLRALTARSAHPAPKVRPRARLRGGARARASRACPCCRPRRAPCSARCGALRKLRNRRWSRLRAARSARALLRTAAPFIAPLRRAAARLRALRLSLRCPPALRPPGRLRRCAALRGRSARPLAAPWPRLVGSPKPLCGLAGAAWGPTFPSSALWCFLSRAAARSRSLRRPRPPPGPPRAPSRYSRRLFGRRGGFGALRSGGRGRARAARACPRLRPRPLGCVSGLRPAVPRRCRAAVSPLAPSRPSSPLGTEGSAWPAALRAPCGACSAAAGTGAALKKCLHLPPVSSHYNALSRPSKRASRGLDIARCAGGITRRRYAKEIYHVQYNESHDRSLFRQRFAD